MRRYRAIFLGILLVTLLVAGGAAILWGIQQTPEFYEAALESEPEPSLRRDDAKVFVQRTLNLVDGMQNADRWAEQFTQSQINSWLAEELQPKYGAFVPEGVSHPRVQLSDETIEIGFRYRKEPWNSIVSVKTRPWVPRPNSLAFEIISIRAGLVPIPLESIIEELSAQFELEGWRVEWGEANGNDVVILHFTRSGEHEPVLETVRVTQGAISVAGRRGGTLERKTAERESNRDAQIQTR